jgi:thiamine biosynthesis lipoprotein
LQVDLGGIAKGWIAERAAGLLAGYAQVCGVNAGGDMFLIGLPEAEGIWRITLEDPCDSTRALAVLRVPGGAVATSSVTRRRWMHGAQSRHHIIDPRSGEPASTEWLSMTVIAGHAAQAEAFAKALLIAGPAHAQAIADRAGGIDFVGVRRDGSLWGSRNSKELIE